MAKGDHLYVQYSWGTHHAIDLGDGTAIEYGGKGTGQMAVRRVRLDNFLSRGPCYVRRYAPGTALDPEMTVELAWKRLRERRYDLFNNNCEHLAYWCKTGHHWSPQANNLKAVIKVSAVVGLAALIVHAAACASSSPTPSPPAQSSRHRSSTSS
ncbi:MAG: lecithin retinol acyltransferase family protein [Planctomycetes bacterium]|nr:lecithin retinol acyltransferase family protein [Planctomycetota bacterium]